MNYLGIPPGSKSKCKAVWNDVIQRFQQKLAGWKRSYLSKGQRLIMIQSVLASLPIYYLSMFQMPVSVVKEMERIMRNFLWGSRSTTKKISWVNWSRVTLPKCRGVVGIKKLRLVNKALHAKWLWRYGTQKQAIWKRIINQKFGRITDANFLNYSNKSN